MMSENKIVMKTNISRHECNFDWEVNNVFMISNLHYGETFCVHSKCRNKFKSVLKVKKLSQNKHRLTVGFQRIDQCKNTLTMITILDFFNSNCESICHRASKFKCYKDKNIHWCISEKFLDPFQSPIKNREKICSETDSSSSTKNLISCDLEEVDYHKLTDGIIKVKGVLRIFDCCCATKIVSNSNPLTCTTKLNPQLDRAVVEKEIVQEIMNDFKIAREDNLFTDVSLQVSDCCIQAHKFVLCARSPYFQRILVRDNRLLIIDINDMDKSVLESFLRFLYTGTFGYLRLETIYKLYSVADKYEVSSLKKNCAYLLKSRITDAIACDILKLADQQNDDDLKNFAIGFIIDNFDSINIISHFSSLVEKNPELASSVLKIKTLRKG